MLRFQEGTCRQTVEQRLLEALLRSIIAALFNMRLFFQFPSVLAWLDNAIHSFLELHTVIHNVLAKVVIAMVAYFGTTGIIIKKLLIIGDRHPMWYTDRVCSVEAAFALECTPARRCGHRHG
jgi:hypothetical protein